MKSEAKRENDGIQNNSESLGVRRSVWLLVTLIALGVLVLVSTFPPGRHAGGGTDVPASTDTADRASDTSDLAPVAKNNSLALRSAPATVVVRPPASEPVGSTTTLSEPSAAARALVSGVVDLRPVNGILTEDQVAVWKTNLQQLIDHGPDSIPAIREFLAKNSELPFGPDGPRVMGYTSARTALIDALAQIGGPDAQTALAAVLQTTADPHEIALLAQGLDKLDPGRYRQEALAAAREALAMSAEGKLPDRDVAPLFELLQRYGDATTVPELEQDAKRWGFYSMVVLAQLPDGAGVPSLLQIATGPKWSSGARDAAWQMVAQVASEFPDARAALLEQARQNKLSAFNWASMATLLGGDQIHFRNSAFDPLPGTRESSSTVSSGQSLYAAPAAAGLTVERMNQQMALIEELMGATSDPVAQRALQQARALALRRLSQVASVVAPQ